MQTKKLSYPVNIAQYGYSIVEIETKSVCNMLCKFCPYPIRDDKYDVLPDQMVYEILDSIEPDKNLEYVCFSQFNEPLLDERIYDFFLS